MESKTFNFGYSVVNTINNDIIDMQRMDIALSEDDIQSIVDTMKERGGYELPMNELPLKLGDRLGEEMIEDYQLNHADDDFEWDGVTVEFEERMPEELLAVVNANIPTLETQLDYYCHVDDKEVKFSLNYMMPRRIFNKMKQVALSPLNGKTAMENLKEADEVAVHNIYYDTLEEAISKMPEGHVESEPYLKDFPWQVYENLSE